MSSDKEKYAARESLMKARKRHFDSRWRANIASCFETLLNIIPLSKRAIRKQSKANILKAAEEHLGFLEAHLSTLLLKKAERENVDNVDDYCALSMIEIKEDFIEEQHAKPRRSMRYKTSKCKKKRIIKNVSNVCVIQPRTCSNDYTDDIHQHESSNEPAVYVIKPTLLCDECVSDDEGFYNSSSVDVTPRDSMHCLQRFQRYNIKEEVQLPRLCRRSLNTEFAVSRMNEDYGPDPQMLFNISCPYVASDITVEDEIEVNIENYDETDVKEVDDYNSQMSSSLAPSSPASPVLLKLPIISDPWMAPSCFASLIAQNMSNTTQYNDNCKEETSDQAVESNTDAIRSNLYDSSDDYIGRHSPLFGALMQF